MKLPDVAAELYALDPGEFTTARNQRVGELRGHHPALAREIAALRKPSVAAWAINQLVRDDPDAVARLRELGTALADAQRSGDASELRVRTAERRRGVTELTLRADTLAEARGVRLSAAMRDDVEQTLTAAVVDPAAAAALAGGTLLRALVAAGLEPVDLTDATGVPLDAAKRPRALSLVPPRGDDRRARERADELLAAEEERRRAEHDAATRAAAERRLDEAEHQVARLTAELAAAKKRAAELRRALD